MLSLNGTGPGCVVHTQLLKLQKEVGFPMRLQLGTQNNRWQRRTRRWRHDWLLHSLESPHCSGTTSDPHFTDSQSVSYSWCVTDGVTQLCPNSWHQCHDILKRKRGTSSGEKISLKRYQECTCLWWCSIVSGSHKIQHHKTCCGLIINKKTCWPQHHKTCCGQHVFLFMINR